MAKAKKQAAGPRIMVASINVPGYSHPVDAVKYEAMRKALLRALPARPPGLTQAGMREVVAPLLPRGLFPDPGKVAWWAKVVQLDLEARHVVAREATRPLRWHRYR